MAKKTRRTWAGFVVVKKPKTNEEWERLILREQVDRAAGGYDLTCRSCGRPSEQAHCYLCAEDSR